VQEERAPLTSGAKVVRRAAAEFVAVVNVAEELGLAKAGDDLTIAAA
jgi:hypothetical protein